MSETVVRPYREGDERAIRELFSACFAGKELSAETWIWKYRTNPCHETLVTLCWSDEGRLIAHYAGIPLPAQLLGKSCPAAQAVDSMCHPAFRGARLGRTGVFVETAKRFYADHGRPGVANLVFGFAGQRHLKLGRLLLGYTTLCEVAHWARPLDRRGWRDLLLRPGCGRVVEPGDFGSEADAFWRTVSADYPSAIVRDAAYLTWRYKACPHRGYRPFVQLDRDGRWQAWAVLSQEERTARIVDMLFPLKLPGGAARLLQTLMAEAVRGGATRCEAWMPEWAPGRSVLERCGFVRGASPERLAFTVSIHDPDLDAADLARTIYYQMGDADIF
jgi:hypothetical protein